MAAYDNVSLPGAPDIANAGKFGTQLFSMLQNLGQDYQKGQDFQYQQQQRNLFQSPDNQAVLQDAIKTGNYSPLLQKLIQSGGASTAAGLVPSLMSIQGGKEVGDAITGGGSTANLAPTGQTPAMLNRQPGGGQSDPRIPTTNPASLSAGGDGSAPETVRSLTAGIANGRPVSEASIANYAKALGVHPDADLTPDQEARAQTIIGNNLRSSGSQSPPPATNDAASGGSPINSAAAGQGNESPVVGSGGGAPISPAQTTAQGGGSLADRFPQYGTGGAKPVKTVQATQPGLRESPVGTEAEARQLQAKATQLRAIAARIGGINKGAAEQAKDAADKADDRAKQIFESIGEYNKPTDALKNVQSGAAQREAEIKDDTTRYGKQLAAIQGSAQAANRQLEHIQLAEGLYKNPNFYSGAGEGLNLMYKRVVNALNPGNTESLPQEAFRKTMAAAVLNQVEQLKDDTAAVGGGGRIFQAQIELMEKAANNPDNSVNANRLLTEIAKRGALESKHIAEMANSYNGGHLDARFAQKVDDYYTKHPMFTPDEVRDIRRIAPPVAPKLDSEDQAKAWARKAGLNAGEPMKLPSGRIIPAP